MAIEVKGNSSELKFITELQARGLHFAADEPLDKGGQNTAVTPMELLGGALSSCTIITLQMYFNHKGWAYDLIEVDVDFDYSVLPITFNRIVRIKGNFEPDQLKRIEKIVNACPVHKLLEVGHTVLTKVEVTI